MAKKLSDALAALAVQTKNLENKTSAASQETKEKLAKRIADLKIKLQAKKDQFVEEADALNSKAGGEWNSFKDSLDLKVNHIKNEAAAKNDQLKEKIDVMKHDHEVSSAQKKYDDSIDYVSTCIDWASAALLEVEDAVYKSYEAKLDLDNTQKN